MDNRFFKTGPAGGSRHYHILYLAPGMPPAMSTVDGHVHEITQNEDGTLSIMPDPVDGHTHGELEQLTGKKPKKEDPAAVVAEVLAIHKQLYETEKQNIVDGRLAEDFYMGEQWDEKTKTQLESEGRACLTINLTEKHIDDLTGIQRQQRTDLRFLPIEGTDQRACDMLNIVADILLEQSYYERAEAKVFENQCIPGRGIFEMRMDFRGNPEGDFKISSFPWDQALYGAHNEEDLSDCEVMDKWKMVSVAKLKQLYKDKVDDIDECMRSHMAGIETPTERHVQHAVDQYGQSTGQLPKMTGDCMLVDIVRKEMAIIEMQRRVYETGHVVMDQANDYYWNAFGIKKSDIKQIETIPGLDAVPRELQKIRITRVCGTVLLSDENPADLPADDFFTIPVYGKRRVGKFWGKVKSAIDPQREVNKRTSQSIDIVNRMAAYGWFYDDSTFTDDAERRKFEEQASTPGFTQKIANVERPPEKVEGIRFPSEVTQSTIEAKNTVRELISVSVDHAGANTTGTAFAAAEKQRMVGSEFLFDNLSMAKKQVGRLLVRIIKRHYSAERIYRMVASENGKRIAQTPPPPPGAPQQPGQPGQQPGQPPMPGQVPPPSPELMVGGQPFSSFDKFEIIEMLENNDLEKVDVVVGESSWTPSERMANLSVLTDLVGKGLPVPPEILVSFMDIPEDVKQKTLSGIQQQSAQTAGTEQAKADAEVEKTIISATGVVPPKTRERFGLPPDPAMQPQPPAPPAAAENTYSQGLGGAIP